MCMCLYTHTYSVPSGIAFQNLCVVVVIIWANNVLLHIMRRHAAFNQRKRSKKCISCYSRSTLNSCLQYKALPWPGTMHTWIWVQNLQCFLQLGWIKNTTRSRLSCFGLHLSVIAAFTPAQTSCTKGGNALVFDSIEPNKTGIKMSYTQC